MENKSVNRYLKDKAMDYIDHALGRPVFPLHETYRNYFAIGESSEIARGFKASPNWDQGKSCGDMSYFFVSATGRQALVDYLQSIGDKNRLFIVDYAGMSLPVVSTSHSKARYSKWLDISDCNDDLTFMDFCKSARVKLAPTKEPRP